MIVPFSLLRRLALAGCLLALMAAHAQFFPDVPSGLPASRTITDAAYHQLLEGYPDGNFRPEQPLARAESVMVLARLLNVALKGFMVLPGTGSSVGLHTIPSTHWSYAAASFLADHGMLDVYAGSDFRPMASMTKGELLSALYRVLHTGRRVTPIAAAKTLARLAVIPDDWPGALDAPILRKEAAHVLDNTLAYLIDHAVTEGTITRFETDEEGNRWAYLDTALGECRLALPPRGIQVQGGAAENLTVGARIRTLSDAVAGIRGDRYYRVREVNILGRAPA